MRLWHFQSQSCQPLCAAGQAGGLSSLLSSPPRASVCPLQVAVRNRPSHIPLVPAHFQGALPQCPFMTMPSSSWKARALGCMGHGAFQTVVLGTLCCINPAPTERLLELREETSLPEGWGGVWKHRTKHKAGPSVCFLHIEAAKCKEPLWGGGAVTLSRDVQEQTRTGPSLWLFLVPSHWGPWGVS